MAEIIVFNEVAWTFLLTSFIASSFLLGSIISSLVRYPKRLKGDLSSFSAGIFFSTVSFILIDESIEIGSYTTMALGFILGALTFSITRRFLQNQGNGFSKLELDSKKDEFKSDSFNKNENANKKTTKNEQLKPNPQNMKKNSTSIISSSATTVIIGKLMDSIPKALFIGVIVALDLKGLLAAVLSLYIGNLTATMEGARRMREEGKSALSIFKGWLLVAIIVGISGPLGYYLARPLPNEYLSIIIGFAAGDLIAFIVEDLIPEAYKKVRWHTGLSASLGFLLGITIFHFL